RVRRPRLTRLRPRVVVRSHPPSGSWTASWTANASTAPMRAQAHVARPRREQPHAVLALARVLMRPLRLERGLLPVPLRQQLVLGKRRPGLRPRPKRTRHAAVHALPHGGARKVHGQRGWTGTTRTPTQRARAPSPRDCARGPAAGCLGGGGIAIPAPGCPQESSRSVPSSGSALSCSTQRCRCSATAASAHRSSRACWSSPGCWWSVCWRWSSAWHARTCSRPVRGGGTGRGSAT
ncbi:hypothetical protein B0H14DRAFT_2801909, partial [Mycena olivaceomarginata]